MRGWIKWLSQDGTRGLITNEVDEDFSFDIRDVIGRNVPKVGQKVEFDPPRRRIRRVHGVYVPVSPWRGRLRWLLMPFAWLATVAKIVRAVFLNPPLP